MKNQEKFWSDLFYLSNVKEVSIQIPKDLESGGMSPTLKVT